MMRQYARVKGIRGKNFTYRDIQKVYMIVLYEKSPKIFKKIPDAYLHHGKTVFDTGLKLDLLQEYFLISLDVFHKFPYPKERKEQTGWLSLLTTENLEDAKVLIPEYPWLEEIYKEIAMLRQKPEEVLGMYSEALRILDQNTIKYMIDELQKDLEEKDIALEEKDSALKKKDFMLKKKDTALKEKDSALKEKDSALKEKDSALKEKDSALKMKDIQIEELKKQLQTFKRQ